MAVIVLFISLSLVLVSVWLGQDSWGTGWALIV